MIVSASGFGTCLTVEFSTWRRHACNRCSLMIPKHENPKHAASVQEKSARNTSQCLHAPTYAVLLLVVGFAMPSELLGQSDDHDAQRYATLAKSLISQGGSQRGVAALLGADPELALALVQSSELLIHVRDPRPEAIDAVRSAASAAGIGIDRIVAERGSVSQLPYADNMIDVVIAVPLNQDATSDLSVKEVLRVLRPEGRGILGKAMLHQGEDVDLDAWIPHAESAGVEGLENACQR